MNEGVLLRRLTTIGTGGPARFLAEPRSVPELVDALAFAQGRELPVATIGLGSNILVPDEGFEGVVIRLRGELAAVSVEATTVVAGGGASLAVCLHRARAAGLGGLEFVCAIPGSAGGGVWMNAGAYGGDIARVLKRAFVVDRAGTAWRTSDELELEYRRSGLRHGQVVARVEFALKRRPPETIKATVTELQALRKAAQPTIRRTFGSVFKNPAHELSAGRMLDACGLRGHRIGGAQISPKHANFIENAGDATTSDALALIGEARRVAQERFGVTLETEVVMLQEPASAGSDQ